MFQELFKRKGQQLELYRSGQGDRRRPSYIKQIGERNIRFGETLEVGFPRGMGLRMPFTSLGEMVRTLREPVPDKESLFSLMIKAIGVVIKDADASVIYPRRTDGIVNTLVSRNHVAPALMEKYAAMHGDTVLRTTRRPITFLERDKMPERVEKVDLRGRKIHFAHMGQTERSHTVRG